MPEQLISMEVVFFASLKQAAGLSRLEVSLPGGASVADLKMHLSQTVPGLESAMHHAVVSVNYEYAEDSVILPDGAEVAIFPPVSGGAVPTLCLITDAPLDANAIISRITQPTTGAVCSFTGLVRGVTRRGEPHDTQYLEYEAYQPMAEAKMRQVADEIRARWPTVEGIALVQRVGRLYPGTPSTMIACTAPHRDTGVFEAAHYGIDRLKEIVPVWKKEIGSQGEVWVEGDYHPKTGE